MNNRLQKYAYLLGTIFAVCCVVIPLDFIEGDGVIWLPLYTLGIFMLTNRINRIYYEENGSK